MCTPRSSDLMVVRSMVASSPACPPQAMLAEVMYCISAASCWASSSSPMSQLRSIIRTPLARQRYRRNRRQDRRRYLPGHLQSVQPFLLLLQRGEGLLHGDALEMHFVAGAQLSETAEIGGNHVGGFGISAGGLMLHEENDRLAVGWALNGPQGHAFGEHVAAGAGNGRAAQAQPHAIGFLAHHVSAGGPVAREPIGLGREGEAQPSRALVLLCGAGRAARPADRGVAYGKRFAGPHRMSAHSGPY